MITRSGWGALVATAVLLASWPMLRYPELLGLGVTGLVVLAGGALWLLARPRVRVARRIEPSRVAQGGEAHGVLTVTNVGSRRCPPFVAVEAVAGQRVRVTVPSLAAGASREIDYPLPTDRRGVHPVGPLTVGHSDPLGLFRAANTYPSPTRLWVYPRVHPMAPLPTGRFPDLDGRTSAFAPAGGVAFHSLREYARGDDLRLIHWPSTARTGTLMIRHNVVPHEPRMLVLLDTSAAPYTDESFESAVRVAVSLAVAAFEGGHPVQARTTGGALASAERGASGRGALLDLFAEAGRRDDDPGLAAISGLDTAQDGAALAIVTGTPRQAALHAVGPTLRRFPAASVAFLGAHAGGPAPAVPGAFTVAAATSADFATVWNRTVR
ncbi:DUF58 domain-containing protein [Frankia sp. AgPm24]|uniref:DUF58 domain-containing protein n=1 Tax=Frankia sp. AgPm24 TaxID=631128 RepID=UPI00200D9531|nr:DUF58 domain-containing protein [Frankia sp. AgPm24]MCK9924405.1 DUF58 domain-containing protein [Frankia sp. AgPm24]